MSFDPAAFLAGAGAGKTVVNLDKKETVFSQGDHADAVFYIQRGHTKLSVSRNGKKATIARLSAGDFIGKEYIASSRTARMATATALTMSTVLRIDRKEMLEVLHEESAFSDLFVSFLLARSTQLELDLAD